MKRLRRLLANESGFTMVSIVTGMMVIGMFAAGAYAAAAGDVTLGRKDQDGKRALEAAKGGIEWYTYHLLRDTNYWTYCNDSTRVATPGISLQGMNRPTASWRTLPNSDADFQVELMTADGTAMTQAQCLANPGTEMLDGGVLRVRATGRSRGVQRQLVATFRRNSFLDYLWYTKWETTPPDAYDDANERIWTNTNCDQPRTAREQAAANDTSNSYECDGIWFFSDEQMKGPMHTEDDSFFICAPTLGREPSDNIEIALASSAGTAYENGGYSCTASTANIKGTTIAPAKSLDLPPTNAGLENVADIVTTGKTCVTFNSNNTATVRTGMTWSETIDCSTGGTAQNYTLGTNTVIYAKNGAAGCTGSYQKKQRYNAANSCGDVAVSGTYGGSVTIGAANDIIVTGDLEASGDKMIGLIGQNYVRVYHPAFNTSDQCSSSAGSNTSRVNEVQAAILALKGGWIADNWYCGSSLGNLHVTGTIAEFWRGPVGQGSAGYRKQYEYDPRLKYRQPPQFLDPLKAAWHMLRQSEQSPIK